MTTFITKFISKFKESSSDNNYKHCIGSLNGLHFFRASSLLVKFMVECNHRT